MKKSKRVFYYADGPGDIIGTFRQWKSGEDDATQVVVTYSGQVYDICKHLSLEALCIAPHPRKEKHIDGAYKIEHRPKPFFRAWGGIWYFLAELWHHAVLETKCICHRSDVALISDCPIWLIWLPARLLGTKIIALYLCTLWPAGFRPRSLKSRVIRALNGWFLARCVSESVVLSPECKRQLCSIAGKSDSNITLGLPLFRPDYFASVKPPKSERNPFRLMYVGRIEAFKGVFEILDIAQMLEGKRPGMFHWEMCGNGSAQDQLRSEIDRRNLADIVVFHGQQNREEMHAAYGRCHAVIVPTTRHFPEGLCQVPVEAALAGRPSVCSSIVPAVELLSGAAIEVPADDVPAFAEAILSLAGDQNLYEQKSQSCAQVRQCFYDYKQSWGWKLREALARVLGLEEPQGEDMR